MENRINRPPSGNFDVAFLGGSSRKRKSTATDKQGAMSESMFQYYTPWESNLQKVNMLSGALAEENTHSLCFNQPRSIEPTSLRHPHEKHQLPTQTCYPGSSLVPPQPIEYKGSFDSLNMQAGTSVVASNWQLQPNNMSGPSEAYTFLPFSKSDDAHKGKAQVDSRFDGIEGVVQNHLTDVMPSGVCSNLSKGLTMEMLQQSFLKPKGYSDDIDGMTWSQEDIKGGVSYELRQSSNCSNIGGINDITTIRAASLGSSLCTEQSQNHIFLQSGVQLGSSGTSGVHLGKISGNEEQGQGDGSVKIKETAEASDTKNMMHPLPDSSSKNSSPTSTGKSSQTKDRIRGSPRADEKSKPEFGKPASTVAEKLWDGSVQLNSSVVVSAVAFFKSGEKLLDTNWNESVEVKGKVRLEAFEKYIQDLPRSRNRGLMVISLCWKEGSSGTGLTGMKEVAKGYKKGEKVGRAQLSPGIDLYICPRSDAIITILAKYGFFKGMAAVEDKPDSMIGCVVWRKNGTSSKSVAKKLESKNSSMSEKPLNSPFVSHMQKATEKLKHSPVTQPAQGSIPPASVTTSLTTEGTEKNGSESQNINSSKNQIEIGNSLSCPEQHKTSLELLEPIMPFPFDTRKETTTSFDDDDLPEFDFRTACGISQTNTSKPSDAVVLDKRLPSTVQVSVSSQRLEHSKHPLSANEGMPPFKKICDSECPKSVFPGVEERSSGQTKPTTTLVSATVFSPSKNLFDDDDDDMPEWCPPFPTLARGPPRPLPPSPSPPFHSPHFPPTTFPGPSTNKSPQPRPLKRGPSSSMASIPDSILGPLPRIDTKRPFYPDDKRRGRR